MPARCFIAVDLPGRARAALSAARGALLDVDPRWAEQKWVDPALLHVTVAFLGAVPDPQLESTVGDLAAVAARFPAFELRLSGARAVPGTRRASMVWAETETDAELGPLRDELLCAAGCEPDPRAFRPHITLVRARRPHRIDGSAVAAAGSIVSAAGKGPDGWMSVPSLTLYASTLGPGGPSYERIADLRLGG